MDLTGLQDGMYLLTVTGENQTEVVKLMVSN
jgi:hypothetical protein